MVKQSDINNAQKGCSYREKFQAIESGLKNEINPSHSALKGTKRRAKNPSKKLSFAKKVV